MTTLRCKSPSVFDQLRPLKQGERRPTGVAMAWTALPLVLINGFVTWDVDAALPELTEASWLDCYRTVGSENE